MPKKIKLITFSNNKEKKYFYFLIGKRKLAKPHKFVAFHICDLFAPKKSYSEYINLQSYSILYKKRRSWFQVWLAPYVKIAKVNTRVIAETSFYTENNKNDFIVSQFTGEQKYSEVYSSVSILLVARTNFGNLLEIFLFDQMFACNNLKTLEKFLEERNSVLQINSGEVLKL
jgi:hypothetical protein